MRVPQLFMHPHAGGAHCGAPDRKNLQLLSADAIKPLSIFCMRYLRHSLAFIIRESGIMALNEKITETPLTRRNLLTGFGAAAATAAFGAGVFGPGGAQAQTQARTRPVWVDAARWARSHDGVAVMVNLGTKEYDRQDQIDHLQDQLDQAFRAAFWNRFGVQARVFFELEPERRGSVITYYMRDMATEPAPAREAATPEAMQHVIDRMEFYDRLGPELRAQIDEDIRQRRLRQEQAGAAPAPQG